MNHPELRSRILRDQNGETIGNNFVEPGEQPLDDHGHGTHTAGIVSQISPEARIMPIKVLNSDGQGELDATTQGIRWAVDHGARIILISLGIPKYSADMDEAVRYAWNHNVLVVAAAGNRGMNQVVYPAGSLFALGVGATNEAGEVCAFSNSGPHVGIVAKGEKIDSLFPTYPVSLSRLGLGPNRGVLSGTSQAAARVAGIAARLWASSPTLTNEQLYNMLLGLAQPVSADGWTPEAGYGEIGDAERGVPNRSLGTIRGQVITLSGAPIAGGIVQVGDQTATTNTDGTFRLQGLPSGVIRYTVNMPGVSTVIMGLVTITRDRETLLLVQPATEPLGLAQNFAQLVARLSSSASATDGIAEPPSSITAVGGSAHMLTLTPIVSLQCEFQPIG